LPLLESHLIAAAQSGLARAKPRNLPGETNRGPEIPVVIPIPRGIRLWRVLADKFRYGETCADSRFHPPVKASAGDSENRTWSIGRKRHQTARLERHAVTFPTHANIQRQILRYLPVVFDEDIAFVLYSVANP